MARVETVIEVAVRGGGGRTSRTDRELPTRKPSPLPPPLPTPRAHGQPHCCTHPGADARTAATTPNSTRCLVPSTW